MVMYYDNYIIKLTPTFARGEWVNGEWHFVNRIGSDYIILLLLVFIEL